MATLLMASVPPWPSLYNPAIEILPIERKDPVQPGGFYLYNASDIFRFTFYWTVAFYTPVFLICGTYAFWNYAFMPAHRASESRYSSHQPEEHQLSPAARLISSPKAPRTNERRTRATFALIVFLTFATLSLAGAVIGSGIMGFVSYGLFKSANFNMSTWIPFLLAVMQVVIGLLSVWPSIIEII